MTNRPSAGSPRLLSGADLAGFIKERQAREARRLTHDLGREPQLAIVLCSDDLVIGKYVALKQKYGEDIGVTTSVHKAAQNQVTEVIDKLNQAKNVDGIIVQLPLPDPSQTDEVVDQIDPVKDVDGLGKKSKWDPATPTAILWLLAGYNIDLRDKRVLLIGQGRLVGAPLSVMLDKSSIPHEAVDVGVSDLKSKTQDADIIITATGQPALLRSDMVKPDSVIIDAGSAEQNGRIVGDVDPAVYDRDDISITPVRGGVGPLTIAALFENVLRAATILNTPA